MFYHVWWRMSIVTPVMCVFLGSARVLLLVFVLFLLWFLMQMLAYCEQGGHSSLPAHCPHAKSQSRVQPHVLLGPDGVEPIGR